MQETPFHGLQRIIIDGPYIIPICVEMGFFSLHPVPCNRPIKSLGPYNSPT
ncbi:MAG: hypothetical protein ABSA50_04035 [Candidatus Bathyarchaeia archaeon]